jgi:hypothetical protein
MLSEFLLNLFDSGDVVFQSAPESPTAEPEHAVNVLRKAFAGYRLEVAGPLIEFDPAAALQAVEFLRWACWLVVHRDTPQEEVEARLAVPKQPNTASAHLSIDLAFRYLAQLHRRARALAPEDVLTKRIVEALRTHPLSGVLADVEEPPTTPLDFAGHAGLQLLYAERFVAHPRDAWRPDGRIAELIELIKG